MKLLLAITTLLSLAVQAKPTSKCTMASLAEMDQYVACLDQLPPAAYHAHLEQLSMELELETGVSFDDLNAMTDDEIDDFIAGLASDSV